MSLPHTGLLELAASASDAKRKWPRAELRMRNHRTLDSNRNECERGWGVKNCVWWVGNYGDTGDAASLRISGTHPTYSQIHDKCVCCEDFVRLAAKGAVYELIT